MSFALYHSQFTVSLCHAPSSVQSTGQDKYFNATGREIPLPRGGEAFYGQDTQYVTTPTRYKGNNDGTVTDLNTGLTWQKTPVSDITWDEAATGSRQVRVGWI
jgi:hypothetical protein